jgi:hypothetical protein
MRRAAAALPAILLFLLPACRAHAADRSGAVEAKPESIHVGVGGAFKVGRWASLDATIPAPSTPNLRLEVDAPDPDGSAVTYQSAPANSGGAAAKGGESNRVGLLFKIGRLDGTLRVRVLDGERLLANQTLRISADPDADVRPPYRQSVFLIANVQAAGNKETSATAKSDIKQIGRLLAAANQSAALAGGGPTRTRTEVVDIESFDALPTRGDAYDSIDAVLLAERFDLDAARARALEQWVLGGGHLIISIGRGGNEFAKTPLAAWLPVKVQGTVKLRDLSPVESFCRQSSRIMSSSDDPLDAARLLVPGEKGQDLIPSPAGPLLCRVAYGMGRVSVFGLDLGTPLLANWSAAPDLVQRLFDLEESQAHREQTVSNRLTQTGITELATQLDGTLDDFPAVSHFTVWHVMGLLAALVLVVGPVDFLLVHKVLRRPELTWITFPLMALAAAACAVYWSADAKGGRLLLNQIDVVDLDAGSGSVRAHSYGLIYSPENRRFNVTADAEAPRPSQNAAAGADQPTLRIGWHGRPETTFGGMYRTGGAEISRPNYGASVASRALEEVPIAIWSTKNLEADWSASSPGLVDSQLETRGLGHLGGTLRHHFSEPIEDWIVAFGHQVFRPRLDPQTGQPLPLLPDVPWAPQSASQRELNGYLTGAIQTVVTSQLGHMEELRTEHADYDPLNRDQLDILRMLTFHTEAGGSLYTGLQNGALRKFDWSPLLDLNRAVLVGRVRHPLTRWKVDGQIVKPDQSSAFVRIVLPVRSTRRHEQDQ